MRASQDEVAAGLSEARQRRNRRIGMGVLLATISGTFVAAGVLYYLRHPRGSFIESWNWYVSLALGLLATGGLSVYFFLFSSELPREIHRGVNELVVQLRSTLQGYDAVTQRIVDVCGSATSYYYAATLMPLIGAIGPSHFYEAYRRALLDKINAGVAVQLVFLDDEPRHAFMQNALKDPELARDRVELVDKFIESYLGPRAVDPEFSERLLFRTSAFVPYQICIADGERAVLYFGGTIDLTRAASVRAFYTEDRALIEVLGMGFEELRRSGVPRFEPHTPSVIGQILEHEEGGGEGCDG